MRLDDYEEYMLFEQTQKESEKPSEPTSSTSGNLTLLPFLIFAGIGLPVLGIYMCFLPNKTLRIWGAILIALGVFLWCNKIFV